jgi:tetraacyldisaccharide 4'-kinase
MLHAPNFWWQDRPDARARLLSPLAAIYGAVAARHMAGSGVAVDVPVVCVGNFVVGGAGKTPTAMTIARLARTLGLAPAFVTRGYGGRPQRTPVAADTARHRAADVGDEPLLLARAAPTFVCTDRHAAAGAAVEAGATLVIMDDGLQNPSLRKDLRIAVVDGKAGIGNGLCLPAGPLRAPMPAQWQHVDLVVIIDPNEAAARIASLAAVAGKPVLVARLCPDDVITQQLAGRRVIAFAGIGRPEKFFTTLAGTGAEIVARQAFPDHHPYAAADLDALTRQAATEKARLVTTEKDQIRLPPGFDAIALPVQLSFDDEPAAVDFLQRAVRERPSRRGV